SSRPIVPAGQPLSWTPAGTQRLPPTSRSPGVHSLWSLAAGSCVGSSPPQPARTGTVARPMSASEIEPEELPRRPGLARPVYPLRRLGRGAARAMTRTKRSKLELIYTIFFKLPGVTFVKHIAEALNDDELGHDLCPSRARRKNAHAAYPP